MSRRPRSQGGAAPSSARLAPVDFARLFGRKAALGLLLGLIVALGLSACGAGETTVTVTRPVEPPTNPNGSGDPGDVQTEDGVVAGYTDQVKVAGETLVLTGWAAAADLSEPATQVAAIVGGKALAKAVPTLDRSDVVEALGEPGVKDSGFELPLPLESLECEAPAAGIEVKAELNGKAGVLEFGEGVKEAITEAC